MVRRVDGSGESGGAVTWGICADRTGDGGNIK